MMRQIESSLTNRELAGGLAAYFAFLTIVYLAAAALQWAIGG